MTEVTTDSSPQRPQCSLRSEPGGCLTPASMTGGGGGGTYDHPAPSSQLQTGGGGHTTTGAPFRGLVLCLVSMIWLHFVSLVSMLLLATIVGHLVLVVVLVVVVVVVVGRHV